MESLQIKFKKWNCKLAFGKYENRRVALQLIDSHDFQPIAKCTINIPELKLKKNQIVIKNYAENEGMLDSLVNAGVVRPLGYDAEMPFGSSAPVCELLIMPERK